MSSQETTLFESLFHHIALPRFLPGKADSQPATVDRHLTTRLITATEKLRSVASEKPAEALHVLEKSLRASNSCNQDTRLNKATLLAAFQNLQNEDALILHVAEQNAGLIIRRELSDGVQSVVFETFEASPKSNSVMESTAALIWDFPGTVVSIPYETFIEVSFQDNLATFLARASTEPISQFASTTKKAGIKVVETRDTVDPSMITSFLASLLQANGRRIQPRLLRKRIRDEVCWDNAIAPWRRAPFYLVLRVSIQRLLYLKLGGELGRVYYKFLMAIFLMQFLHHSLTRLSPDLYDLIKAKLCRRIAKLEGSRLAAASQLCPHYEKLFMELTPAFNQVLEATAKETNYLWNTFKERHRHRIPALPERAENDDLRLRLPKSSGALQRMLAWEQHTSAPTTLFNVSDFSFTKVSRSPFRKFAERHISMAVSEDKIELENKAIVFSRREDRDILDSLIEEANKFLDRMDIYEGDTEQLSNYILLVFELWTRIDARATKMYPLLKDYHPGFRPQILDVLELPSFGAMVRLSEVQRYLRERCTGCHSSKLTIFANPSKECFAYRYMEEQDKDGRLRELEKQISTVSDISSAKKLDELETLTEEYNTLALQESQTRCTQKQNEDETHDIKGCSHCYAVRCQRRLRIGVHEDFLPGESSAESMCQRKVVVFELGTPAGFSDYRELTFRILTTFGYPQVHTDRSSPKAMLSEYGQLKRWAGSSASATFTLASTKKSFLDAHYNTIRLPVISEKVLHPHGLRYEYYDSVNAIWASEIVEKPSLAHLFPTMLFPINPSLKNSELASDADGPSSYQVLASQTYCPPGLNVNEFLSFQSLCSGKNRRWLMMLIELGSSNLNFSNESTMQVFSHLSSQAGPEYDRDTLRTIHIVFRDSFFCRALLMQVQDRISAISSNWRETYSMELLLILARRLWTLGVEHTRASALALVEEIRTITLRWVRLLRVEARTAPNEEVAQRATRYGLWASLICRRTFSIILEGNQGFSGSQLRDFVETSIALQEYIDTDPEVLPKTLRNILARDIKTAFRMRTIILHAIKDHPESLQAAIDEAWPQPGNCSSRSYSEWVAVSQHKGWWVTANVGTGKFTNAQSVHFNFLDGGLLIDGKPLGALPSEVRKHPVLMELFGQEHLLTYPSGITGMSYVLDSVKYGHQIHLGFVNGVLEVKAIFQNTVLQLVDRSNFIDGDLMDLPKQLVQDCTHWLDLRSGVMEIRRYPHVWWQGRLGNWNVHFYSRKATRRSKVPVTLVDPHSSLAQAVNATFRFFEEPSQITIFQPLYGKLNVEMKRLDLSFVMTQRRLLLCRQLGAEIDPNQDIGSLYGLQGKIVLRDVDNKLLRVVLIPAGSLKWKREGIHVISRASNNGIYLRFTIDDTLGRLQCPPEPMLLYSKALFHSVTSFILPDPLTGRTGTEEALHCLKSAKCQPWNPVGSSGLTILATIANFSPRRHFYPKDLRCQQTITRDQNLTMTVQHDDFRPTVEKILAKSKQLSLFSVQEVIHPHLEIDTEHLRLRAAYRASLYTHRDPYLGFSQASDTIYTPRDRLMHNKQTVNVYEVVMLLRDRNCVPSTTKNLAAKLKRWPVVGGFDSAYAGASISESLNIDLVRCWGSLVHLCRKTGPDHAYKLMFQVGLMAFAQNADMEMIRTLLAFHLFEDLKKHIPPPYSSFVNFDPYERPCPDTLEAVLGKDCFRQLDQEEISCIQAGDSPSGTWSSGHLTEVLNPDDKFDTAEFESLCALKAQEFVQAVLARWPCSELSPADLESFDLGPLDVTKALESIGPEWQRLWKNLELMRFLDRAQIALNNHRRDSIVEMPCHETVRMTPFQDGRNTFELPSLAGDLLAVNFPFEGLCLDQLAMVSSTPHAPVNLRQKKDERATPAEVFELQAIIGQLREANQAKSMRKQYVDDLSQSLEALKVAKRAPQLVHRPLDIHVLEREIQETRKKCHGHFGRLSSLLAAADPRSHWLLAGGLWPRLNPTALLEQLRSTSSSRFGENVKEGIVSYALSLIALQRVLRILHAYRKSNNRMVQEELGNQGHLNWEPMQFTDWLLLELDSNILIREDQVDVALAMITPASGANSVLQMNMGQGKTSCVMPMVSAELANGKQLNRVIAPGPLLLQTAQTLQSRLGGLIGREVRHVPFSRKTPATDEIVQLYRDIHEDMLNNSGVILALPEHLLSFMLSGRQNLSDSRIANATAMIEAQEWLNKTCRDVLDECDVSLAVQTQLIYPSGSQLTLDGLRWEIAESLLGLVKDHLWQLEQDFPHSIKVVRTKGIGYPAMYFLRTDVEDALLAYLVDEVCSGRTSILPAEYLTKTNEATIRTFISAESVGPKIVAKVSRMFPENTAIVKKIYLLRGLLVHRILVLCLKKRWNVQYGLDPDRDPIAVPCQAKGVSKNQSEWGHPDVSILFTCLSLYFGGLTLQQFRDALQHVLNSDDPSSKYNSWIHTSSSVPESLHHWYFINLEDEGQVLELWNSLQYSKVVIDYYLDNLVFMIHAKQFSLKLQASGWDLPLFNKTNADAAISLTTGFSGTNDNRRMLPLNIRQEDLPALSFTNAEVLTYLLETRNRNYEVAANYDGTHLTEQGLLAKLSVMNIRILIDAGAYILEMDNRSVAKAWMEVDAFAKAAVYFGPDNRLWVAYRAGKHIPLVASHFADNLSECLIYLDENHTRGTDLKLPANARAALTLGLGQTKDYTMQAAMRLRQLGTTQAVIFFAPPQVHQSILDLREKQHGDKIDSSDVIYWILEQSFIAQEQHQPLYIAQGKDFVRRTNAAWAYPKHLIHAGHRASYLKVLRQPELLTLEELYKPRFRDQEESRTEYGFPVLQQFQEELAAQYDGSSSDVFAVHGLALGEVEQQREVAYEVEEVRESQKPVYFKALPFPGVQKSIIHFVRFGELPNEHGYEHFLVALARTEIGLKFGLSGKASSSQLYVSTEFSKSVKMRAGERNDNFLRPVNYILWSPGTKTALVVIPEEIEVLLPMIRDAQDPSVHLILYAAPVTKNMQKYFDDLKFFSIPWLPPGWKAPDWLKLELGILAGRLYFSFDDYTSLKDYIARALPSGYNAPIPSNRSNGKALPVPPQNKKSGKGYSAAQKRKKENVPIVPQKKSNPTQNDNAAIKPDLPLGERPLAFFQEYLAIKRKGQDFTHTPMGYLCSGRVLQADHAFFVKETVPVAAEKRRMKRVPHGADGKTSSGRKKTVQDEDYDSDESLYEDAPDHIVADAEEVWKGEEQVVESESELDEESTDEE